MWGSTVKKSSHFQLLTGLLFLQRSVTWGRYAKNEFGIQVVYHPHVKTMIEYESEIIRLLDATGLQPVL